MTDATSATTLAAASGLAGAVAATPLQQMLGRFKRHRAAMASLCVLSGLALLCALAGAIEAALGVDHTAVDLTQQYAPASARHWLGTDELGRDVLVRLLYGGRVSLTVGVVAAAGGALIGTLVGLLAGFYGGRLDALLMRFTDTVIALPVLPLLIILSAVDMTKFGVGAGFAASGQASLWRIVVIIALFGWTTVARLVRGSTLAVKQRDYVRAARALGAGDGRVMRVHVLPNVVTPIIVASTLSVGSLILTESILSFLGLGIRPPMPSWGNMLTNAQETIWSSPLLAVWPGLLIFVTVIAFNFVGDGLQDAFDPRAGSVKR